MFIDQLLEKVDTVKDENGRTKGAKTRAAFAGIIVGGIIGLMIGYSKKWNLFYSAVTGVVVGGGAGALLVPKSGGKK